MRTLFLRADVQTGLFIGVFVALVGTLSGATLYGHLAVESLEEADRWFGFVSEATIQRIREHGSLAFDADGGGALLADLGAVVRVRDAQGRVSFQRGSWPPAEHRIPVLTAPDRVERGLLTALRVDARDYLEGRQTLPSGEVVELALPLAHLRSELVEARRWVLVSSLIYVAAGLLIGFGVTARAFLPLRRATDLLRRIDARSLGQRLPSRGTGDPMDVHAETLNGVLEAIDASFTRLHAFSSDVAHELRTPLNRITNVSEVALLEGSDRGLRSALESVGSTAEELARVVQSLLLLAEIDDRRIALSSTPIQVKRWIDHTLSAYTAPFEDAGVKLVARCDDETIEGDRTLLDRVLANLLDNALAHAPWGSHVEIGAVRRGSQVVISVEDEGSGIPPSERERVFQRFARLDPARHRPGHGLGLALARAIVRLHDGELAVEDAPRGGARFEARLPAHGGGATLSGRSAAEPRAGVGDPGRGRA